MSNFKRIFGLAGAVVVFTGLASAQLNCNAPTAPMANAFLIRGEGTTEQVADLTVTCVNGATATPAGALANFQVFLSAPVTSKVLSTSGSTSGLTEALLVQGTTGMAGIAVQQGLIGAGGSSIQFNGVPVGGIAAGATTVYTITNVRVNASTISVGTGAPPPVTESVFVSGSGVTATASSAVQVAFVQNGLAGVKSFKTFAAGVAPAATSAFTAATSGTNNVFVCTALTALNATALNVVQFSENFANAFKAQGSAATNNILGSEFTNNTETGFVPTSNVGTPPVVTANTFPQTGSSSNIANSATRVKIVFANVPSGLTLYVPTTVTATNSASTFVLQLSETAASGGAVTNNATSASTSSTVGSNLTAVTATGGAATAVYEYNQAAGASAIAETFNVPVQAVASANAAAASATAITETVSFAPTGSTNIPNFVAGTSATTLTGSTFSLCTTSLLFPFVTSQLGFDTGLAISNTSTDPFGTTPQSGTCTLNFYGSGAPTPANVVSPNVPTGTTYTTVVSGVAPGFQGYVIANCNFQFGHGLAFLTTGLGSTSGVAEGYVALVLPSATAGNRNLGAATESLGQ